MRTPIIPPPEPDWFGRTVHGVCGALFGLMLALWLCRVDLGSHAEVSGMTVGAFIIVPLVCALAAAFKGDGFWMGLPGLRLDFQEFYLKAIGIGFVVVAVGLWVWVVWQSVFNR